MSADNKCADLGSASFMFPLRRLDEIVGERLFGHAEPPFDFDGHIWYVTPEFSRNALAAKYVLNHMRSLGFHISIETLYGGWEVHIGSGYFGCDSLEEAICRAALVATSK